MSPLRGSTFPLLVISSNTIAPAFEDFGKLSIRKRQYTVAKHEFDVHWVKGYHRPEIQGIRYHFNLFLLLLSNGVTQRSRREFYLFMTQMRYS